MPRPLRFLFLLLAIASLLPVTAARAQLTIEIIGSAGTTIPIAIVPFDNESTYPLGITGIVAPICSGRASFAWSIRPA